jgi:hypothetical protein
VEPEQIDLFAVEESVAAHEERVGYAALTEPEKFFLCVWQLEAEINNGGFDQYFLNSSGDHAVEAALALGAIGAPQMAKVVGQAIAVFGPDGPAADWDIRQEQLDGLPEGKRDQFNERDEAFLAYPEDLEQLLRQYVAAHFASFPTDRTQ